MAGNRVSSVGNCFSFELFCQQSASIHDEHTWEYFFPVDFLMCVLFTDLGFFDVPVIFLLSYLKSVTSGEVCFSSLTAHDFFIRARGFPRGYLLFGLVSVLTLPPSLGIIFC